MKPGYYESLDFNAPMTEATADRLVAELAAAEPASILDVGCGWAELLLRLLDACPGATGLGVDHDEALIARAVANASARNLDSRVQFAPEIDDLEAADLVVNIGAEHVFGSLADAVAALFELVKPGGRLLLGTQIWERPPTPDLLDEFGPLPDLGEFVTIATDAGFRPLGLTQATVADWDEFEFGFLGDWEQVVMAAAEKDVRASAREAADRHRNGYLRRRGSFGFVYLTLGRPLSGHPSA